GASNLLVDVEVVSPLKSKSAATGSKFNDFNVTVAPSPSSAITAQTPGLSSTLTFVRVASGMSIDTDPISISVTFTHPVDGKVPFAPTGANSMLSIPLTGNIIFFVRVLHEVASSFKFCY